ncbi:MAG: 8-amino-7-oxononanoate synthase [Terriglobia bacterium]|nr:MAG: 8-amino-7-oxononanoate synthase [Terriglobia bacterium]
MPATDLERRVRAQLARLESEGLLRSLRPPGGIDLSSNDYLGLSRHPLVAQRMSEAIARDGCGSTGSRLLRGDRACFTALEDRFAAFKGAGRALLFSSGYLANLAVLTTFCGPGDVVYSDERNHASLIDGIRLSGARKVVYPHCDVSALRGLLREEPGQKFVVTESLFSMDGDFAPLAEYDEVCRAAGAALIVDEAHAVGVYGARGSGLLEACRASGFLSINTAGKALGVSGALVAGPEWAIEYLVQRARPFVFSTAPPPPVAAALDASFTLIAQEPWRRDRLHELSHYARMRLVETGVPTAGGDSQIIPVILGDNQRATQVAQKLQRDGFDVRAIRPPSVAPGSARLRISVNANLSEATLDRFTDSLASALKESAACSAVCL